MIQKEIDKLLANTKVYVAGKSKEIQEKLFSLGYCWHIGGSTEVKHENDPFLFIYKVHSITCSNDMIVFTRSEHREISAEEILSIELTESDYRPFKSKEECWSEMMKHTPLGWVFSENKEALAFIYFICTTYIRVHDGYSINGLTFNYEEMFDKYTFADGTPFGVKEI